MVATIECKRNKDGFKGLMDRFKRLKKKAAYVGIPQANTARGDGITNAELLYIHTHGVRRNSMIREMSSEMKKGIKYSEAYSLYIMSHGSPLWHSPPRPVIEPAIKHHKHALSSLWKDVLIAASKGNAGEVEKALGRLGMAGQNYARGWFTNPNNHWPPNSPKTVKLKGSSNPLIDTGTLRKSITYVVKEDGND